MIGAKYCVLLCLSSSPTTLVLSAPPAPPIAAVPVMSTPFFIDEVILEAATEHKVDPVLIRSIIAAESSFESNAVSDKGAIGYMQLMPETAEELGYDPADKHQNIHAGCKYMRLMIDRYKGSRNGLQRAIAAYNAGPGNVDRYKGIPPFRETRKYVKRVMAYRSEFLRADEAGAD